LYHINSVLLRFFTVYGPRQRPDLAINKFFTAIEENKPIFLFGDGSTSRDYTFIGDIIEGIMSSIGLITSRESVYAIINLGNNKPTGLLNLIQKIEEIIGKKAELVYKEMQPGDVIMTCADTTKALQLLNYTSQTSLDKGLHIYYQWRQSQQ
jgi:UDP-glucuronate 4-epimerase